jgi:hypothetical protein
VARRSMDADNSRFEPEFCYRKCKRLVLVLHNTRLTQTCPRYSIRTPNHPGKRPTSYPIDGKYLCRLLQPLSQPCMSFGVYYFRSSWIVVWRSVRNGLVTDICDAALFLAHMDKVGGLLDNVTQSCINALTDWCASYQKGEIAINSSRSLGLFVHKELLSWKPKPYRPIQRMLELNFLTHILDTNYVLRQQTDLRINSK